MTLHDLALKVGVTTLLLLIGLSLSMADENPQGKGKRYADIAAGFLQGITIACGTVYIWTLPNG